MFGSESQLGWWGLEVWAAARTAERRGGEGVRVGGSHVRVWIGWKGVGSE